MLKALKALWNGKEETEDRFETLTKMVHTGASKEEILEKFSPSVIGLEPME